VTGRRGPAAVCGLALGLACAGAPPPLPSGVSAAPAVGDPLPLPLQKLPHVEKPGPSVELEELRVVSVKQLPWTPLDPAAATSETGPIAVVAGRSCTEWEGLERHESARASWFLLRGGAVVAFDHDDFAPRCEAIPSYVPTPLEDIAIERMLMRYATQRWPGDSVTPDERLSRGLALLEVQRGEDALLELQALDRDIAELERRRDETEDDVLREDLARDIARLGPQRARLHHALREWREQRGETVWDG
jgi:hypothetical protein